MIEDGQIVLIRATHPSAFRSGEWARLNGVVRMSGRPCFEVEFLDGKLDWWPITDAAHGYEFK